MESYFVVCSLVGRIGISYEGHQDFESVSGTDEVLEGGIFLLQHDHSGGHPSSVARDFLMS